MKKKSRPEDYITKTCNMCGIEKERDEFHKTKTGVGGLNSRCVDCESIIKRKNYAAKKLINMKETVTEQHIINELPCEENNLEPHIPIFKTCNRCKISKDTRTFHRINDPRSKSGISPYCKICDNEMRIANRAKPAGRFKSMISDAKRWKHDWSLTYEEFLAFWQKPCNYCGAEIKTCSLDRVDASLGYSVDNVVPCCHDCNQFKMDQAVEDFKAQIAALYLNLDGIRNVKPFDFDSATAEHCHICGELNSDHIKKCREFSKKTFYKTEEERAIGKKKIVNDNAKTPRGRYSTYKKKAKFKEISWLLSQDDFFKMWKKPCSYCLMGIGGIGVDRIDSFIGYQADNVTPCCGRCNAGKMNHSASGFADLIERIYIKFIAE